MSTSESIKVAVITDDGKTISQHFGRAQYYLVATVENGQIVNRELRQKLGHAHFADQPHAGDQHDQPHGLDADSHNKHLQMAEAIADCKAVICGGMGRGAYESMRVRGIRPMVTTITEIETAVASYAAGTLADHVEKLH